MKTVESFIGLDPWNCDVMDSFLSVLCEELEVSRPKLIVTSLQDPKSVPLMMMLGTLQTCYMPDFKMILLVKEQIRDVNPLTVLAHELRHHQQYEIGRLTAFLEGCGWRTFWDGKEYNNRVYNQKQHAALPPEVDAIQYENEIADRLGAVAYNRVA